MYMYIIAIFIPQADCAIQSQRHVHGQDYFEAIAAQYYTTLYYVAQIIYDRSGVWMKWVPVSPIPKLTRVVR